MIGAGTILFYILMVMGIALLVGIILAVKDKLQKSHQSISLDHLQGHPPGQSG